MKVINPVNQNVLREIEEDSLQAIADKYRRARAAQPAWAALPLEKRLECLRKFRKLIEERKDEMARATTSEVGKPLKQSHNELNGLLTRVDFFLESGQKTLSDEAISNDGKMEERIVHEPLGVIANISAWNYPYFVGSNVFVPALLAGNAVLYKPSEFALLTGLEITRALHDAGVPKDIFVPILGAGRAGATLLEQKLDGVFFTGSYATGKKIAEAVAGRMIKVQLELGGKDPVYIADDADPKTAAAATADGAMYNAGQSCCSVERIYVHEKIYDAFLKSFVDEVKGFVSGDPLDEKTYIGPLTRAAQLEVLEKQVKDAISKGAKVLLGGRRGQGNYFEPTVLTDVNHSMELMREESFGPVIGIQKVSSDTQAIELMNDTPYGLTAGVYTPNRRRAESILAQVNSGSVYWNCCDRVSPRLPWSGRGNSGMGLTLSTHGILAFTKPKAWHLRA